MRGIIRRLLGVLALALLAFALWPASREVRLALAGEHALIPLGQLWFDIDPPSLNMAQAGIQRHVAPWLWEDAIQPLLTLPAWPVLLVLALMLVLVRPGRRPR